MAENPFSLPDSLPDGEANWAFNPSTYADTPGSVPSVPDGTKRLNGWSNSVPDEPSPSHTNYLHREALKLITWLEGRYPRHFTRLDEPIGNEDMSTGRLFYVDRDTIPERLFETVHAGDTTNAIYRIETDGQYVYTSDVGGTIRGFTYDDPLVANELWTSTPFSGIPAYGLAADGLAVYAQWQSPSASTNNLKRYDRITGSVTHQVTLSVDTSQIGALDSNGDSLTGTQGTGNRDIYIVNAADLTATGKPGSISNAWDAISGSISHLSIGADRIVGCGSATGTGSYQVKAWNVSAGTTIWSYAFSTTTETCYMSAQDGEYVYVVTEQRTDAGVAMNVICFSLYDGSVIWRRDCGGDDARSVAVDDRVVWVQAVNGANMDAYAVDKRNGEILGVTTTISSGGLAFTRAACADGLRFLSPFEDDVVPHERRTPARLFQKVAGGDVNRMPFYTLAVPMEGP
jgi:hypothetical protein